MKNLTKITKGIIATAMLAGFTSQAQLIDEKDVTVTMDLQPVLQLEMTTPNQIEFIFDDVVEYQAGIIQYAATTLKVSSTVNWDLYAIARSQGNIGATYWDQEVSYGNTNANAVNQLPLSLLELKQSRPNNGDGAATGTYTDYSGAFTSYNDGSGTSGQNSIYVDAAGTGTPPTIDNKYIAGHAGTTGVAGDDFMPGGSYLTQTGAASDYYYNIDYRILPGLPATFPMAYAADGTTSEELTQVGAIANASAFAEPGVYTMYVQYVLLEDQ